jgi:hypothetical protein
MHYLFRELDIGDTFDFVDDSNAGYNSFFKRCTKTGDRTYQAIGDTGVYKVGKITCKVFHVERNTATTIKLY